MEISSLFMDEGFFSRLNLPKNVINVLSWAGSIDTRITFD